MNGFDASGQITFASMMLMLVLFGTEEYREAPAYIRMVLKNPQDEAEVAIVVVVEVVVAVVPKGDQYGEEGPKEIDLAEIHGRSGPNTSHLLRNCLRYVRTTLCAGPVLKVATDYVTTKIAGLRVYLVYTIDQIINWVPSLRFCLFPTSRIQLLLFKL